jgi:hypothetical protein
LKWRKKKLRNKFLAADGMASFLPVFGMKIDEDSRLDLKQR